MMNRWKDYVKNLNLVTDEELVSRISFEDELEKPEIVLIRSVCRSGSTPLMQVIANSGFVTLHQPIKSILRNLAYGNKNFSLTIPKLSKYLVVKETYGPYSNREWALDYLDIFERLGYEKNQIKIVDLQRNPVDTFKSCRKYWDISVKDFVSGFQKSFQYAQEAKKAGYSTFYYSPSQRGEFSLSQLLEHMFEHLQIISLKDLTKWVFTESKEVSKFLSINPDFHKNLMLNHPNILVGKEPDFFRNPEGHKKLVNSLNYSIDYLIHDDYGNLTDNEAYLLNASNLNELHKDFLQMANSQYI